MSQITEIELEIESIQTELNKLKQERSQLEQNFPIPVGDPEQIATAAKAAAVALAERQPQLTGVNSAIALLEQQLLPKQRMLVQLKAEAKTEQERLERAERLRVAEVKIQDQVEKIHDLSALLEIAFWNLKGLSQEFNPDYRQSQQKPDGLGSGWSVQDLIQFNSVQVPQIVTLGDRFVVQARSIDLYQTEKDAARVTQLQRRATRADNREEVYQARQLAEAQQKRQREIENLRGLLAGKRQELVGYERQVAALVNSGYTKSGSNLRLDDRVLDRLKTEINELETQLQQQEKLA